MSGQMDQITKQPTTERPKSLEHLLYSKFGTGPPNPNYVEQIETIFN